MVRLRNFSKISDDDQFQDRTRLARSVSVSKTGDRFSQFVHSICNLMNEQRGEEGKMKLEEILSSLVRATTELHEISRRHERLVHSDVIMTLLSMVRIVREMISEQRHCAGETGRASQNRVRSERLSECFNHIKKDLQAVLDVLDEDGEKKRRYDELSELSKELVQKPKHRDEPEPWRQQERENELEKERGNVGQDRDAFAQHQHDSNFAAKRDFETGVSTAFKHRERGLSTRSVYVSVIEGRDLAIRKRSSKILVACKRRNGLDSVHLFRTPTCQGSTQPVWNFNIRILTCGSGDNLEFAVFELDGKQKILIGRTSYILPDGKANFQGHLELTETGYFSGVLHVLIRDSKTRKFGSAARDHSGTQRSQSRKRLSTNGTQVPVRQLSPARDITRLSSRSTQRSQSRKRLSSRAGPVLDYVTKEGCSDAVWDAMARNIAKHLVDQAHAVKYGTCGPRPTICQTNYKTEVDDDFAGKIASLIREHMQKLTGGEIFATLAAVTDSLSKLTSRHRPSNCCTKKLGQKATRAIERAATQSDCQIVNQAIANLLHDLHAGQKRLPHKQKVKGERISSLLPLQSTSCGRCVLPVMWGISPQCAYLKNPFGCSRYVEKDIRSCCRARGGKKKRDNAKMSTSRRRTDDRRPQEDTNTEPISVCIEELATVICNIRKARHSDGLSEQLDILENISAHLKKHREKGTRTLPKEIRRHILAMSSMVEDFTNKKLELEDGTAALNSQMSSPNPVGNVVVDQDSKGEKPSGACASGEIEKKSGGCSSWSLVVSPTGGTEPLCQHFRIYEHLSHTSRREFSDKLLIQLTRSSGVSPDVGFRKMIVGVAKKAYNDDPRGWIDPETRGWPSFLSTLLGLADPSINHDASSQQMSISLLAECLELVGEELKASQIAQDQFYKMMHAALQNAEILTKSELITIVCQSATLIEPTLWAALIPNICFVLRELSDNCDNVKLEMALINLAAVAENTTNVFKTELKSEKMELVHLLGSMVKKKDKPEDIRILAVELLVTLCKTKPKWITSNAPAMIKVVLESCMDLMLDNAVDEESLDEWMNSRALCDNESHAPITAGKTSIEAVVDCLTMEACWGPLSKLIENLAQQEAWQGRVALLMAIRQTIEYVEDDDHVNEMANLLLAHTDHPHPIVRHWALIAIAQVANDHGPEFPENWHNSVMPVLFLKMDDPVEKNAAIALTCFVTYAEQLGGPLLKAYAHSFMEKIIARFQSSEHHESKEECVTSIAVIAGSLGKEFSPYYDLTMPIMIDLAKQPIHDPQDNLPYKAFECISIMHAGTSEERYAKDVKDALNHMLRTNFQVSQLHLEYITEALQRICKALGPRFRTFVPDLLEAVWLFLSEERPPWEYVELSPCLELLQTCAAEMKGSFYEFVNEVAERLEQLHNLQSHLYPVWAELIKCARTWAEEQTTEPVVANKLLRKLLHPLCQHLVLEKDPEKLTVFVDGLCECLGSAAPGVLTQVEVTELFQNLINALNGSLARTSALSDDDEDDEDDEDDDEEERTTMTRGIIAVAKASPTEFAEHLPCCVKFIQECLSQESRKALGLGLTCGMFEYLKERFVAACPDIVSSVLVHVCHEKAGVRLQAANAIGLAAIAIEFEESACAQAFQALCQIINESTPKKRDEEGKLARDMAILALVRLCQNHFQHCSKECHPWPLVLDNLPLKGGTEIARLVHKTLSDLAVQGNTGLLGENERNLPKMLSVLAEIHRNNEMCDQDTDQNIVQIFRRLDRDQVIHYANYFTEKQQNNIEDILALDPDAASV